MSKHELVDAYVRGRIGRREFIKGLRGLGVSAAAALVYAQALGPTALASGLTRNAAGYYVAPSLSANGIPYGGYGSDEDHPTNEKSRDDALKNQPPPGTVVDENNPSAGCDPLELVWNAGGGVRVLCGEDDEGNGANVAAPTSFGFRRLAPSADPSELTRITSGEVLLLPEETPNSLTLVIHYTDDDVAGLDENTLRVFYDAGDAWVELPATIDTLANTASVANLDVSAFGDRPTTVGLFS